ncbi:MAG TPA: biotin-dependent carboxyltransferase family protein [Kofleriaceae bacterium]|jgi:allophanate hydrolase subunit 2|nr:biotin-dependent carboxyltransferase family protein [Kofleriaceae bacterium]
MSLTVVRALGLVTIQDLGRPGRMHEAVPPGGALVRDRLIAANRGVHNPDDAPAIEVIGRLVVRAGRPLEVATDTTAPRTLAAGDELTVASEPHRVAYLAIRGGIAAPLVLGGRGALLSAGLGGLIRAGQVLASARLAQVAPPRGVPGPPLPATMTTATAAADDAPIRVIAGPDPAAFAPGALDLLRASTYRILPTSDRVGTRLDGPALPRSEAPEVSRPMVLGAIEVPRDGQPIVLGPEHPTTGGYPIIAVVASADLGRLFSIRPGGAVRFGA